jgi:hypothetical protein
MAAHGHDLKTAAPRMRVAVPDWLATFGGIAFVVVAYRAWFSFAFAWGATEPWHG